MLIQTFFTHKCVCYLTPLRRYTCLVVTTILNKQTIRNKTKTNNNHWQFLRYKRASKWPPLLVNKAGNAEALTAAPALIDQVWYGWRYSRQQSVEDRLRGLQVWHTLGHGCAKVAHCVTARWRNFSHYCRPLRQCDVFWAQRSADRGTDSRQYTNKRFECKGQVYSSPLSK